MAETDPFYEALPRVRAFEALTRAEQFTPVPAGWLIGVSDIVNSTELVAAGQYKTVNMTGAAVISAVMNALSGAAFPFVFGGDGAGFAIPPQQAQVVREALARVARWAQAEFSITLRVALVPVEEARSAGTELRIARYQASEHADYAMFDGGALNWAEAQMKAGAYGIAPAPEGAVPDLTGLSCRWSALPARNGVILSVLMAPEPGVPEQDVWAVYDRVVSLAQKLERGGHPVPPQGPGTDWPPAGATLEAHAQRGGGPLGRARRKVLFEALVAKILIWWGISLGGFNARRYARVVGENADFRKLDDGLKMTLDCDAATQAQIEEALAEAAQEGLIRYGTAAQDAAMMTCIVPSIQSDDHVHFVDGAAGGYTLAASRMKGRTV